MFYVYCREYYPVWEPAEGGYYVCCSEISECGKFYSLEDAYEELLEMVIQAEKQGSVVHNGSWFCGFVNDPIYDESFNDYRPDTRIEMPWFEYDYTGYIGDGFEIGISLDEPKDEPYMGYC